MNLPLVLIITPKQKIYLFSLIPHRHNLVGEKNPKSPNAQIPSTRFFPICDCGICFCELLHPNPLPQHPSEFIHATTRERVAPGSLTLRILTIVKVLRLLYQGKHPMVKLRYASIELIIHFLRIIK
ncbi:hypothetical protein SESBI_09304 [Sesbania bispinosa]|nr:hypothetical protein SESBI_09304 [Sesbania bispinosa]